MKIEILLTDNINEKCTGMSCFEANDYIKKAIVGERPIQGIVIIDGLPIKFSFSAMGMDGDIFTTNENHRILVKYLVPIYVYNNQMRLK